MFQPAADSPYADAPAGEPSEDVEPSAQESDREEEPTESRKSSAKRKGFMAKAKGVWKGGKKKLSSGKKKIGRSLRGKRKKKDPWQNEKHFPPGSPDHKPTWSKNNPLIPERAHPGAETPGHPPEGVPTPFGENQGAYGDPSGQSGYEGELSGSEQSDNDAEIIVPINAYDTDPSDQNPGSSDASGKRKKKKGMLAKAAGGVKGMFSWRGSSSKSKSKSGDEMSDLENGRAIPSEDEADNHPKKKKKGKWRRFKGWMGKKKRGAAKMVGFGPKENSDDKGAAFCCMGMSLKSRYIFFWIFWLLALTSLTISVVLIAGKEDLAWKRFPEGQRSDTAKYFEADDGRQFYFMLYMIGTSLMILSVGFMAGLCRQLRVFLRYGRFTSVLIVAGAIIVNIVYIEPEIIHGRSKKSEALKSGPIPMIIRKADKRRRLVGSNPAQQQPVAPQQMGTVPVQGNPGQVFQQTQPAMTQHPVVTNQPPAGAQQVVYQPYTQAPPVNPPGAPNHGVAPHQDLSRASDYDEGYTRRGCWTFIGVAPEYPILIMHILQSIAWMWYCITFMPCMRQCVHSCCKKKKKDKKKEKENEKEEEEV